MKKSLVFLTLLLVIGVMLTGCSIIGGGSDCQHRDADDNGKCDTCGVDFEDEKDIPDAPVCQHRDADDNGKCDTCGVDFEDEKDIPDEPVCQHRDADDNGKCDTCGVDFEDEKDIPDEPVCQHRDADDNGKCDTCDADFEDEKDIPDEPVCQHRDADDNGKCDTCGVDFEDGKDAFSDTFANGIIYEISEDGTYATVVGYDGTDATVIIADRYEGLPVQEIGSYAFYRCTYLTNVTIPDSVTTIRRDAFASCSSLANIDFGGVTLISEEAFYDCTSLTNVIIPDSVTQIGGWAFSYCTNLMSVTIGNAVETIGDSTFSDCTALKSVTIPDSVTSIYDRAFKNCTALTSVIIGDSVTSIGWSAFHGCTTLETVTIGNSVKEIGEQAFRGCATLTSITIPDFVETIENSAFQSCINLTSITIGASVHTIESYAFHECPCLTTVYSKITTHELNVHTVGNAVIFEAAYYTYSEAEPTDNGRFWHYDENGEIAIWPILKIFFDSNGDGTCFVGDNSAYTGTDLVIPAISPDGDRVIGISELAFSLVSSLESVVIPNSVTTIGWGAFAGCFNLTSITLPKSITSIEYGAFLYCDSLEYIFYMGDAENWNAIEIDFSDDYNESLLNATLYFYSEEEPIESGNYWYYDADGTITIWASSAHEDANLDHLCDCGCGLAFGTCEDNDNDGTCDYGCGEIFEIKYSEGLAFASNGDGTCRVSGIGTCTDTDLIIPPVSPAGDTVTEISARAFFFNYTLKSAVIPNSVTKIGNEAFCCTSLASVQIPNSVTQIGMSAFSDTALKSVEIPDSVTKIGVTAFSYSTALISITVGTNNENYQSIDGNLYKKDGKTLIQYAVGKTDTSFTIPDFVTSIDPSAFACCNFLTSVVITDSVTSIGDSAFVGCTVLSNVVLGNSVAWIDCGAFANCTALTSIAIPSSVKLIDTFAFDSCTSLTSVYYKGDEANWNAISVGSSNSPLTEATRYYYSEEMPTESGNYWYYDADGKVAIW